MTLTRKPVLPSILYSIKPHFFDPNIGHLDTLAQGVGLNLHGCGNFLGGASVSILLITELDTVTALRYNGGAVKDNKIWDAERGRFSSEVMTHLDHLYRVALYLVKNEDEAKDCVQETCARALNSYRQFDPGSNMKAWLTRILYNFFFDTYQRGKRTVSFTSQSDAADAGQDYFDRLPADDPEPEEQVLQQELSVKIKNALQAIPEEFRAPILLVDMGDFSYAEAADILSCPIGTVRSRLSRGRRLLQGHLRGYLTPTEAG